MLELSLYALTFLLFAYFNVKQYTTNYFIFILISSQVLLLYLFQECFWEDIVSWLTITDFIDVLICLCFMVRFTSRTTMFVCISTIIVLIYNIISYVDYELLYIPIRELITDHYLQGLILFVDTDNKYLKMVKYSVPTIGIFL